MRSALFVNFRQIEAPPALEPTVSRLTEELAAHCPSLSSCRVYVLRETEAGPVSDRFRVRVEPGPRFCDKGRRGQPVADQVDRDLGRALRRAFDAAKRKVGQCDGTFAAARTGRAVPERALLH